MQVFDLLLPRICILQVNLDKKYSDQLRICQDNSKYHAKMTMRLSELIRVEKRNKPKIISYDPNLFNN